MILWYACRKLLPTMLWISFSLIGFCSRYQEVTCCTCCFSYSCFGLSFSFVLSSKLRLLLKKQRTTSTPTSWKHLLEEDDQDRSPRIQIWGWGIRAGRDGSIERLQQRQLQMLQELSLHRRDDRWCAWALRRGEGQKGPIRRPDQAGKSQAWSEES